MPSTTPTEPRYFDTPEAFRAWLRQHAATSTALVVGFHKRGSGTASMSWPESVDEALCVGWIDGVRQRIDDTRYQIRFTPRKPGSTWSAVNIERVRVLSEQGRMLPAGLAAFALRQEARSRTYAYEQRQAAALDPEHEARFRREAAAWAFFERQAPSWRHKVVWGVVSAKLPATRERRLQQLIAACAEQRRI